MSSFLLIQIQQDLILFNRVKIMSEWIKGTINETAASWCLPFYHGDLDRIRQMHHPTQGQSLWPGPPSHFILWDCMTCVVTLESYLRNLAPMTLTLITSNTQISHGLLLALPKAFCWNQPQQLPFRVSGSLIDFAQEFGWHRTACSSSETVSSAHLWLRMLISSVLQPHHNSLFDSRHLFGTELLVGWLWLSMLKAQLDPGLLTSQNM